MNCNIHFAASAETALKSIAEVRSIRRNEYMHKRLGDSAMLAMWLGTISALTGYGGPEAQAIMWPTVCTSGLILGWIEASNKPVIADFQTRSADISKETVL